jgi:hypothetical protein
VLGHFEGLAIVFVSAEPWTQRVFIRLCAAQNDRTRTLYEQFRREFEVFTQGVLAARERGDAGDAADQVGAARPEPPAQPGEVLSRVPLVGSDDLGTAYRPTSSAGGTGSEWRGECYGWPVEGHNHLEDETDEVRRRG